MTLRKMALPLLLAVCVAAAGLGVYLTQAQFGDTAVTKRFEEHKRNVANLPTLADEQAASTAIGLERAQIALDEYSLGVVESSAGCNCGSRIDLYTDGNPMQWCASFASWVSKEAGSPLDADNGLWRIGNSRAFSRYLQGHGTFYTREQILSEGITPRAGDFIVFFRGNFGEELGHVDILINETGDGRGDLIGGNLDNRLMLRSDFPYLNYYGFLGFGRPEIE